MRISRNSLLKNISNSSNSKIEEKPFIIEHLPNNEIPSPDFDDGFNVDTICECNHCKKCMNRELYTLYEVECACVYEDILKTEEEENQYVDKILKTKCQRCIDIDTIKEKYRIFELYDKAYIDEYMWDNCYYFEGSIYKPIYEEELLVKTGEEIYNTQNKIEECIEEKVNKLEDSQGEQNFAIDFIMFEVVPQMSQTITTRSFKTIKLGIEVAGYLASRIMCEVVTYEFVFSVQIYKKYQDEVDQILILEGFGHLIKK